MIRDRAALPNTPESSFTERFAKWRHRHPRIASTTTVTAFALLVVTMLLFWQDGRERWRKQLPARRLARHGLGSAR
jgi:hypothetical protein